MKPTHIPLLPLALAATLLLACGSDESNPLPATTSSSSASTGQGGNGGAPAAGGMAPMPEPRVTVVEHYDVSEHNAELKDGMLTVDVSVTVTIGSGSSWNTISKQLMLGRDIFLAANVQLRVIAAQRVEIPSDWQTLDPSPSIMPKTPELLESDLYAHLEETQSSLAPRTAEIIAAILSHVPQEDLGRTLHLVTFAHVPIAYWEWDGAMWTKSVLPNTGGLSMPSYILEDRIPFAIRGVFTISGNTSGKTLYHEMGHKLLNVSHEGAGTCPSFEADGPELMLYGSGTLIGSGAANRWHLERFQKSPYLYLRTGSAKEYNPPFAGTGNYSDAIYGAHIVSPVCE